MNPIPKIWEKARGNPLTCTIWCGALAMLVATLLFTAKVKSIATDAALKREQTAVATQCAQQQLSIVAEIKKLKDKVQSLAAPGTLDQSSLDALKAAVVGSKHSVKHSDYLGPYLFALEDENSEAVQPIAVASPSRPISGADSTSSGDQLTNNSAAGIYSVFTRASSNQAANSQTSSTLANRLPANQALVSDFGQLTVAGPNGPQNIPILAAAQRIQVGGKQFAIVVGLDLTAKCKELESSDCLVFLADRSGRRVYRSLGLGPGYDYNGPASGDIVSDNRQLAADDKTPQDPLSVAAQARSVRWKAANSAGDRKADRTIESTGYMDIDDRITVTRPIYRQSGSIDLEKTQSLQDRLQELDASQVLVDIEPGTLELRATSESELAKTRDSLLAKIPATSFAWDSSPTIMDKSYYLYLLPTYFNPADDSVHPLVSDLPANDNFCVITFCQAIPIGMIEREVAASLAPIQSVGISVAVLFALAGVVVGLLVTRPIQKLRNAAQRYAALVSSHREGAAHDALALLPGFTWCEIRSVSEALRQLILKVEEQQANLERKIEDATRDLRLKTEQLEKRTAEVEQKRAELEENKKLRELFLHQVNHDLRNPLMAVDGYAEELRDSHLDDDQRECVERIKAAASRMQRLVDDLRDYQSIIQGKALPKLGQVDLHELLEQLKMDVHRRVVENRVDLQFAIADNVPTLYSDRDWIARIIGNLLSNACKFTRDGQVRCSVSIEPAESGDILVIEVQDQGRGLSPAEQEKLFRPYEKILGREENPDGTGLGLVISRGFCETLHGTVNVDPQRTALGKGATFVVRIPVVYPGERPARSGPISDRAPVATNNLALVIDDDPDVCRLLRTFLANHKFEVIEAHDGQAGLDMAIQRRPGVITLDAQLPKLDGWRVLKELKENPQTANIPVVMVTIFNNPSRGFALGADDYVNKPIDWRYFEQVIERYRSRAARILVVDDDASCRQVVSQQLQRRNWEVAEAGDGAQGLEALRRSRPDLILLDLLMPGMDGFEFVRRMRSEPAWKDIPVVVLTGKHLTQEELSQFDGLVEQVLQKGAMAWDDLRDVIGQLLSLRGDRPVAAEATKEVHDAQAISS